MGHAFCLNESSEKETCTSRLCCSVKKMTPLLTQWKFLSFKAFYLDLGWCNTWQLIPGLCLLSNLSYPQGQLPYFQVKKIIWWIKSEVFYPVSNRKTAGSKVFDDLFLFGFFLFLFTYHLPYTLPPFSSSPPFFLPLSLAPITILFLYLTWHPYAQQKHDVIPSYCSSFWPLGLLQINSKTWENTNSL